MSALWKLGQAAVHTHDCTKCRFLGHYDGYDLYFCDRSLPTLIARHGSRWTSYQSGLIFGLNRPLSDEQASTHLRVAYLIADDLNLITDEVKRMHEHG